MIYFQVKKKTDPFLCHWPPGMRTYVPWSKVAILGMVIPPLIGNPYNGYINPYYSVDDHPLLYGNNGSLDPSTYGLRHPVAFKLSPCDFSFMRIYSGAKTLPMSRVPQEILGFTKGFY